MFASQGPKGGTSDRLFQARLPKVEACSPLDALLTLGRADCLLSVYFYQEAAFLCNYVALACGRHRHIVDGLQKDVRWKIVSSLAYDLSVMIRNFSRSIILEQSRKDDNSGTWDIAVITEFKRARSEGREWKAKFANGTGCEGANVQTQRITVSRTSSVEKATNRRKYWAATTITRTSGALTDAVKVAGTNAAAPIDRLDSSIGHKAEEQYVPEMQNIDVQDTPQDDENEVAVTKVYAV